MKKLSKILVVFFAVAMLAAMFSVTAYAKAPAAVSERNTYCSVNYNDVRYAIAEGIADSANSTIERLVRQAQRNPRADIGRLVWTTECISKNAICLINALGFDAECVYETYVINGVEVEIDPIIIIKRG